MARLIELKQTAPERFLARFDTGEEVRTTLAVVTDFHLRSGKELTSPELGALRAASERSRCRQRALRIIGARAMSVKELTDRLKEKGNDDCVRCEFHSVVQQVAKYLGTGFLVDL